MTCPIPSFHEGKSRVHRPNCDGLSHKQSELISWKLQLFDSEDPAWQHLMWGVFLSKRRIPESTGDLANMKPLCAAVGKKLLHSIIHYGNSTESPQTLNIVLPNDPIIALFCIYPKVIELTSQTVIWTPRFSLKVGKQCSVDLWMGRKGKCGIHEENITQS